MVDSVMRSRIADVASHIRRAFIISREIESKSRIADTMAQALDGLSAAVILIDKRREIVHANRSAQSMLASGLAVKVIEGKLVTSNARVDRWLGQAILAVNRGDAAFLSAAAASRVLAGSGDEKYVLHVMPLRAGLRSEIAQFHGAAALLLIQSAGFRTTNASEAIAKLYRLTRSEHRVLLTIVEAEGVPEAARRLAISETTVKTHLHRLFDKTGVNSQTEVAKLVAGFGSSLLD
jgi:DNA-binding NarL/FixJ family response regulator